MNYSMSRKDYHACIARICTGQLKTKSRIQATKRKPQTWRMSGLKQTVSALTKSEARAAFKAMLGVDMLPPHTLVVDIAGGKRVA